MRHKEKCVELPYFSAPLSSLITDQCLSKSVLNQLNVFICLSTLCVPSETTLTTNSPSDLEVNYPNNS